MARTSFLIAFAVLLVTPQLGAAQSFDCAKATGADEGAVCGSHALSALDDEMAGLYDYIRRCALMGTRGDVTDSQRTFLDQRAACGASVPCLRNLYHGRISELEAIKAGVGQGAC